MRNSALRALAGWPGQSGQQAGQTDQNSALWFDFFGFLHFLGGFWGPGGVPAARSRNSASDGLRESPT